MSGNGDNAGVEVLISSDSHGMEPPEILAERMLASAGQSVARIRLAATLRGWHRGGRATA